MQPNLLTVLLTSVIACSSPVAANAAPTKLKCLTSDGQRAADLVVELAEKRMTWGSTRYLISASDDRYISAYQDPSYGGVGGEVFVLNRVTGAYTRATVFMGMDSVKSSPDSARLTAKIYEGKCATPVV